MKSELKENMYIRTNYGIIDKILKLNESYVKGVSQKDDFYAYDIDNIVKASYNIIDILEEGDYVNGQKIYYDEELDFLYVQSFDGDGEFYQESITKQSFIDNIKSVITHEQMEQMVYKVGE